jgi:hypothetical protein
MRYGLTTATLAGASGLAGAVNDATGDSPLGPLFENCAPVEATLP